MKRVLLGKIFFIILLLTNSQLFSRILVDMPNPSLAKALVTKMATKVIEEDVLQCCEGLNSKVDTDVIGELISIESKLDQWVGPLGEVINSKIDSIVLVDQACCQTIISKMDNQFMLDLYTIESKIDSLDFPSCPSLLKGDVITGDTYNISTEGMYTLTVNTQACVTIAVNNVTIDLCGFTLSCDSADAVIEIASNCKNVQIMNGKIEGASGRTNDGILVNSGCELIALNKLMVYSCDRGIYFAGAAGDTNVIKACDIERCFFKKCNKGAFLGYTKKCIFQNCGALNCIQSGFEQEYSEFNLYEKCKALETANNAADEQAIGFSSAGGLGNLYVECVVEGTQKTVESNFGQDAIGFLLTGTLGDLEAETKIINCIANSTSVLSIDTAANAYGIKIESVWSAQEDLSQDLIDSFTHGNSIHSVDWSFDGKYLAIGGIIGIPTASVRILSFDGSQLSNQAIANFNHGSTIYSVNWSSDEKYLAIGGVRVASTPAASVRVLLFDGTQLLSPAIANFDHGNDMYSVNWSPDGKYLAIGGTRVIGTPTASVRILSFDGSELSDPAIASFDHGATIQSVNWSPCGKYLAIGGGAGANPLASVRILSFDGSQLSNPAIANFDHGSTIYSVNWSPCGKYLAIGGYRVDGPGANPLASVRILSFDGSQLSNPAIANFDHGNNIYSVNWSPDGKYLAIGGDIDPADSLEVRILSFDGSQLSDPAITNFDHDDTIYSVNWSSIGKNLAVGGDTGDGGYQVRAFEVMDVTSNCLIDSNRVCNTGNDNFGGVGILASGENLYIRNILYANDVHFNKGVTPRFGNIFGSQFVGVGSILDNVYG